jgi:hypothetical protein
MNRREKMGLAGMLTASLMLMPVVVREEASDRKRVDYCLTQVLDEQTEDYSNYGAFNSALRSCVNETFKNSDGKYDWSSLIFYDRGSKLFGISLFAVCGGLFLARKDKLALCRNEEPVKKV